jgi:hypothetical protein
MFSGFLSILGGGMEFGRIQLKLGRFLELLGKSLIKICEFFKAPKIIRENIGDLLGSFEFSA